MDKQLYGILGTSYCGSTIIGYILDSIDGVFFPGELSILTDDNHRKTKPFFCLDCAMKQKPCPILSREFVNDLTDETLYRKVMDVTDADVIVSSDKIWSRYNRHQEFVKFDGFILMYKRIESFVRSFMNHTDYTLQQSMDILKRFYNKNLKYLHDNNYRYLCFSLDDFVDKPAIYTNKICRFIKKPYNREILAYWNFEHHQHGGNTGPRVNLYGKKYADIDGFKSWHKKSDWHKDVFRKYKPDNRWETFFTPEQFEQLRGDEELNELWAYLKTLDIGQGKDLRVI